MPTGEQLRVLREAGDRLQQFEWDFEVDLRDEELRRRLVSVEPGVGAHDQGLDSTGAFAKISSRGLRAIREHYYERFTPLPEVAHAFFEALSEAGGQRSLARRAGLEDIEPSSFPSALVRFGPVPLPRNRTRDFDAFADEQGGTHVAASRLIWWCAASHRPWEFGYTVDLSWYAWCRIPWIGTLNGRVTLLDGPIEAVRDCVGYLIELVESHQGDSAPDGYPTPLPVPGLDESPAAPDDLNRPKSSRRRRGTSSPKSWAFGLDSGRRWHVFERFEDRWAYRRLIHFPRGPQGGTLLNLFREGRGVLTIRRAYEGLYGDLGDPDLSERMLAILHYESKVIFRRIKSAVSHLKKQLFEAMKDDPSEIIEYEKGQSRYRLLVQIGTAVAGVSDSGNGINTETGSLKFIPDT